MTLLSRTSRPLLSLYQGAMRKLHDLRYLFFELTNQCNLACIHCGSDCVEDPTQADLPAEKILEVLGEIKARWDSHQIFIVLSGGEPLCYPNVFDLGAKINNLEFPWGMVTNGFGWTPKKIQQAKRAGLRSITVSLDGPPLEHDWLRGRKNSYKKAVKTISLLTADRFWRAMDVITCVNERNLDQLDNVHDVLRELGVPAWRLFTISPIGRAAGEPDLFLDAEQYQTLLRFIERKRGESELEINLSESGYVGPHFELCVRDQYYFCRAGISTGGVMVNGDIAACPNIDRRFAQGNVFHDSFVETWEKKYQVFRDRSWMKRGECASCKEWRHCQGNSFHLWDVDENRTKLCHCQEFGLLR